MTIGKVLRLADGLKPNALELEQKYQYINEVEGMVQTDVMMIAPEDIITYELGDHSEETELLIKAPHDKLYIAYLTAMFDFANGEYNKYATTISVFNTYYAEYHAWYWNRYHPADGECVNDGYYLSAYAIAVNHGYRGSENEWLSDLKGTPPELRYNGDVIEWKYADEPDDAWRELLDLSIIKTNADIAEKCADSALESLQKAIGEADAAEKMAISATNAERSAEQSAKDAKDAAESAAKKAADAAAKKASESVAAEYNGTFAKRKKIEKATLVSSGWFGYDLIARASQPYIGSDTCCNGVTCGNGRYVAIMNNAATAIYSDDGKTWQKTSLPSDGTWYDICYGNGKFVAVGGDSNTGIAAYSDDGVTWAAATLSNAAWYSVIYADGKFVAVATDADKAAYSVDGITWIDSTLPISTKWYDIAYGNGKFVVVASDTKASVAFAYSTDGINWQIGNSSLDKAAYRGIAYGNGKFVVLPFNTKSVGISTDGVTWKMEQINSSAVAFSGIVFDGETFVSILNAGTSNYICYLWDDFTGFDRVNEISYQKVQSHTHLCSTGDGKVMAVENAYGGESYLMHKTQSLVCTVAVSGIIADTTAQIVAIIPERDNDHNVWCFADHQIMLLSQKQGKIRCGAKTQPMEDISIVVIAEDISAGD